MEENNKKNGKRKLGVEEMWRIYLETSAPGAQIGEYNASLNSDHWLRCKNVVK